MTVISLYRAPLARVLTLVTGHCVARSGELLGRVTPQVSWAPSDIRGCDQLPGVDTCDLRS